MSDYISRLSLNFASELIQIFNLQIFNLQASECCKTVKIDVSGLHSTSEIFGNEYENMEFYVYL